MILTVHLVFINLFSSVVYSYLTLSPWLPGIIQILRFSWDENGSHTIPISSLNLVKYLAFSHNSSSAYSFIQTFRPWGIAVLADNYVRKVDICRKFQTKSVVKMLFPRYDPLDKGLVLRIQFQVTDIIHEVKYFFHKSVAFEVVLPSPLVFSKAFYEIITHNSQYPLITNI